MLGKVAVMVVTGSLICVVVVLFAHQVNLTTIWTSLSPLFMVGISKTSTRLGKTLEKTYVQASNGFMGQGRFFTNSKEVRRAVEEGIETRAEWEKEKHEINKNKVRGVIIWDIKAEVPVALVRVAELANVEKKVTEGLLEEIVNATPSLGEYRKKEQVFIKKKTDNTSGTTRMNETDSHDFQEERVSTNEASEELVLDRVAIEKESEVNWVGVVRHRPTKQEGWISLPSEMREQAELGVDYDVFMFTEGGEGIAYTTNLRKGSSWYFYIPSELCSNYNLYGKEVSVFIRKFDPSEDFPRKKKSEIERLKEPEWKDVKTVVEWEGKISKGGGGGSGWITVPIELREPLELESFYDITLVDSNLETQIMSAKLKKQKNVWGFYISKDLCIEQSLIGKTVTCYIHQMEHFPVLINEDKIVGLPQSIVAEYKLKKDDLWEVELLTPGGIFREVVIIGLIDRSNRSSGDEYRFTLRLSDVPRSTEARAKFVRKIEKLPSKQKKKVNYEKYYLPKLFPDGILGKVHKNEMIIFLGNHVPVFTPIQINLLDFIHYFGCYYADGTKKGWAWRINASTPEQADYYIKKYNQLVFGNSLVFELTYTMKPSNRRLDRKVKRNLIQFWKEKSNIDIEEKRIWVRKSKSKNIRKWNVCGSLGVRDDRNLVMELHVRVMMHILNYLANECLKDDEVWDFLFGILEGDGFVGGGKARFSVGFATHSSDKMIEKLLTRLGIQHRTDRSRVKNNVPAGISVQFGLFEILLNLKRLCDSLFVYYPKRRRIFIERLLKQSTVKYLLKRKKALSSFAKSFILVNMLDDDATYQLLVNLESELHKMNG